MTVEEAKNNKFYKALVYKYAKSDHLIIVQTNNEYYIFYLNGLTTDYTIEDLLNLYTAKGDNEIIGIEIWQDEFMIIRLNCRKKKILRIGTFALY